MDERELISVVVPAWRAEKTLGDTLDSILSQTRRELEVIVVDDASPDGTKALAQRYAAQDARVRVVAQEQNGGVSKARNRGVQEARGAWIAFLDSDDTWQSDKLERQAALVQRFPDTQIVYTGYRYMDAEGHPLRYTFRVPAETDFSHMLRKNVMSTSGVLLRRELVLKHPFRSDVAHEDLFEWLTLLRAGAAARGIPEALHTVRLTGADSRSGNKAAAAKNRMALYKAFDIPAGKAAACWLAYAANAGVKYLSIKLARRA